MDRVHFVGIMAQLVTYASFLSGAKVCHLIHKQRSCNKLSAAPFLAGLGCTALWLRYGLLAEEWEIITVNLVGLSFQIIYLSFFVVYSKQRLRLMKQLLILVIFLALIFWSIENSSHQANKLFLAGSVASMSSLVACASPLATIQDVLKTKCVASLPFPIIASSCVVSLSWLTFGLLKDDNFIVFSNIVALGISGAQLGLFIVYPSVNAYEKLSPSNKKSYVSISLLLTILALVTFSCNKMSDERLRVSLESRSRSENLMLIPNSCNPNWNLGVFLVVFYLLGSSVVVEEESDLI